jgi:hypothetical protein
LSPTLVLLARTVSRRGRHPQGKDNERRGECAEDDEVHSLRTHSEHPGTVRRQEQSQSEGEDKAGGKHEGAHSESIERYDGK